MSAATLKSAIVSSAVEAMLPSGKEYRSISLQMVQAIACGHTVSVRKVETTALACGILPERYIRNYMQYGLGDQKTLLESRILLVGLGGLGGHVLDMLIRLGVGTIRGADGDAFEAHNLNRQLLSSEKRLGMNKALAAAEHVAVVNSAVSFTALPEYLAGETMLQAMEGVHLVVDCLGGLSQRQQLQEACAAKGRLLVTAAIGGYAGYVATVTPGAAGPATYMGQDGCAAEDVLGTPAPVVAFAASLQAKAVADALLGKPGKPLILFDLLTESVEHIR